MKERSNSMTQVLYLMRHGQTLFNQRRKIQGACDSPLTQLGREQAQAASDYFKAQGIQFDYVYSSTQERACDTAEIVINNQSYERLKGLKEWNFGLFEGESEDLNPPRDETRHSYGDYFLDYGGESDLQVQARMTACLTEVMNRSHHQEVLAVSHGGAVFMFTQQWLEWEKVAQIQFTNCCILKFTYEAGRFEFVDVIHPVI